MAIKGVLLFFIKFCLCSLILSYLWYRFLGEGYGFLLLSGRGLFVTPGEAVEMSLKGHTLEIVRHFTPVLSKKDTVHLLSLTFNVVPLLSLFLATPATSFRWFKRDLPIALFLLYLIHLFHLSLDLMILNPENKVILRFQDIYPWKSIFVKGGQWVFGFMEQVGRELFPFLIWFYYAYPFLLRSRSKGFSVDGREKKHE